MMSALDVVKSIQDIIIEQKTLKEGDWTELSIEVKPEDIRKAIQGLKEVMPEMHGEIIAGIDRLEDNYELVYFIWSHLKHLLILLRTKLSGPNPSIETVSDIIRVFNWHEREAAEMFGVEFRNHPDMRPLLLGKDLYGKTPLRKSFPARRLPTPGAKTAESEEEEEE